MDHIGLMAGCVRDLAILLQATAGVDPYDPSCSSRPMPDLSVPHEISPPRLGRVHGLFDRLADPVVTAMVDHAVATLAARGAKVSTVALPGRFDDVVSKHHLVMAVEAAAYHEPRLRRHPEDYDPCITKLLKEGLACPAPEYARIKEHQKTLTREMQACFTGLDALVMPAMTSPAPEAATTGDASFNVPWSYTGLPTVSFVAGWTDDGLPLALQLVGSAWSEKELLAAAVWCEEALAVPKREPGA